MTTGLSLFLVLAAWPCAGEGGRPLSGEQERAMPQAQLRQPESYPQIHHDTPSESRSKTRLLRNHESETPANKGVDPKLLERVRADPALSLGILSLCFTGLEVLAHNLLPDRSRRCGRAMTTQNAETRGCKQGNWAAIQEELSRENRIQTRTSVSN